MRTARLGYAFDNDNTQATEHHQALAELLDPISRRRIFELIDLCGRKVLDVGTGSGSMARWFADEVGFSGSVLATDVKPHLVAPHPQLRVFAHDITSRQPFGQDYDLIHARLVLNHIHTRRDVVHRLVTHLAPGGLLVTSDFWPTLPPDLVVRAPSTRDETLLRQFQQKQLVVLAEHGNDRNWSRAAAATFIAEGLQDVQTSVDGSFWRGGGPGCRLLRVGLQQVSPALVQAGLTLEDQHRVCELLLDPSVLLHGHLLYTTSGKRPPNDRPLPP